MFYDGNGVDRLETQSRILIAPAVASANSATRVAKFLPGQAKGLTNAGIRKMIARLHEELAVYEGGQEIKQPETSS